MLPRALIRYLFAALTLVGGLATQAGTGSTKAGFIALIGLIVFFALIDSFISWLLARRPPGGPRGGR